MENAEQAVVIPCFVCEEYLTSKACVDEFKFARNAKKLLVIALAPPRELARAPINEKVSNGPVVGHFVKGEQCLQAFPGAPAGDAASDDPRVAFVHCYSRALVLKRRKEEEHAALEPDALVPRASPARRQPRSCATVSVRQMRT